MIYENDKQILNTSYWTLLYDGECPMCSLFAEKIKKFDKNKEIDIISLQRFSSFSDRFKIEELEKDVHLLGYDGEVLKGGEAVQQILLLVPQTKPFRWMLKSNAGKKSAETLYSALNKMRKCRKCGRRR